MSPIPAFLKKFRAQHSLSQKALAESFGVSAGYIGQIEKGDYKIPWEFLKRVYQVGTSKERIELLLAIQQTVELEFEETLKEKTPTVSGL